jgi:hypothetical protein
VCFARARISEDKHILTSSDEVSLQQQPDLLRRLGGQPFQMIERGGLVGPKLTTLIAYLKRVCHASFSTIRKFIRDVVHLTISRGQLSAIIGKVTRALEQPYQELLGLLPNEERVNVDETGHKQNRLRMWTWWK